jgi:hypothetical protein
MEKEKEKEEKRDFFTIEKIFNSLLKGSSLREELRKKEHSFANSSFLELEFLDALKVLEPEFPELPVVIIEKNPKMKEIEDIEFLLQNSGLKVFLFSGKIVKVIDGFGKNAKISEENSASLRTILSRNCNWMLYKNNKWVNETCPEKYTKLFLAQHDEWNVPCLKGIIHTPTLRKNGSCIQTGGYDKESALYLSLNEEFPEIQESPTEQEGKKGLETLEDLLKDFPFVTPSCISVAISAILTSLIRKSLDSAPMFIFSAPKAASGKTLLADVVSLVATGEEKGCISFCGNEAEERKRIVSLLASGTEVICFDNVDKPFESTSLCTILTEKEYRDRILGHSKIISVYTQATFMATGNNFRVRGDLSSRTLLCSLDPKCEHPGKRSFDRDIRKYILDNRAKLVHAGLTILKSYLSKGSPKQNIEEFGRFERWSNTVRSSLIWLGMKDPCNTKETIEERDPEKESIELFLHAWKEAFEEKAVTSNYISKLSQKPKDAEKKLLDVLFSMFGNDLNARRLGSFFRSIELRIEGGMKLKRAGIHHQAVLWQLEKIKTGNDE